MNDKIKISEDQEEFNEDEEVVEITHSSAIKALLYLIVVILAGILVFYAIDRFNSISEVKRIENKIAQINSEFALNTPLPVTVLESYDYDLNKFKDEHGNNNKMIMQIDAILGKLQNQPAFVQTGTHIKTWAKELLIKTETDTVVVPFSERSKYPFKTVFQPTTPLEKRAYDIYQNHPDWGKDVCLKLANKQIWAGMTKSQLLLSWGQPKYVDKDFTYNRNTEQWVYGNYGPFVYLENSVVLSWQE